MMTVVTHVPLKEGTEPEWDSLMLERMNAARFEAADVAADSVASKSIPARTA